LSFHFIYSVIFNAVLLHFLKPVFIATLTDALNQHGCQLNGGKLFLHKSIQEWWRRMQAAKWQITVWIYLHSSFP